MDTQTPKPPLTEQPEPNPKRPKLTTSSGTATATATTKYRRRKIAIIFAYCGVGYQGMQKNPGAKTIEEDFHEALFQSGALPEPERGMPRKFDWARSARTDKGVSAIGQVCSGRFYVDPPGFIERLNLNLPDQIRVFGFKRVTGAFNAQRFCDRRRYVYLVPVFALDGDAHGFGDGVCLECLESGRNVLRVMGKGGLDLSVGNVDGNSRSGILSNRGAEDGILELGNLSNRLCVDGKLELGNLSKIRCDDGNFGSGNFSNSGCALNQLQNDVGYVSSFGNVVGDRLGELKDGEEQHDQGKVCCSDDNGGVVEGKKSEFCYGEKEKERFNRVLRYYEGTHNFHNFTSRITAQDPSAKRYIASFSANTTVNVDGIEFVKCEVVGQSFLLHQIRKMIGLAVVIMRGTAPETLIQTAFRKDVKINVPVAPEVGLYLDECFFTPYNKKWKDSHEKVSMKAYTVEAEDFKLKYIYPHIASMEYKEGTVALWLHYLNHHNYPDLRIGACIREENVEPPNLLNGSASAANIEVENACIGVNGSSGGKSSAENVVVKEVDAEGDRNNDFQNVEVKDTDQ